MQVLIYGGGAVGLGLASCLLKAGQQVTILARPRTARLLRQEGLIRTGIFGPAVAGAGTFGAVLSLADVTDVRFDRVLVCVKSFDSERAAQDLQAHAHLLAEGACIVLCQNGWGNAGVFTRFFAQAMIYNARVITGFTRPAPNRVEVTVHADAIHVGSLYASPLDAGPLDAIRPLCAAITAGDIPCLAVPDIEKDLWAKMLFNCPLNALGAIVGVPYGALGENERSRRVMDRIVAEIYSVMAAAGYTTHWDSPELYLATFYHDLIPSTARHFSSTLQDLRAGKRTEIDALNGAIVELGSTHGVSVPANEVVYNVVKFLESRR
jgi:2-dehydropantoate 2-reductase